MPRTQDITCLCCIPVYSQRLCSSARIWSSERRCTPLGQRSRREQSLQWTSPHAHTKTVWHYTASTIHYCYSTNISLLLYYICCTMLYFAMLYYTYMLYYTCSVHESPCKNTSLHIHSLYRLALTYSQCSPLGYFIHGSTSTPA